MNTAASPASHLSPSQFVFVVDCAAIRFTCQKSYSDHLGPYMSK